MTMLVVVAENVPPRVPRASGDEPRRMAAGVR